MIRPLFIFSVLMAVATSCFGQFIELEPQQNITKSKGDDLSPVWSKDAAKLLFHSNRNGNWDIFIYDLSEDSLAQVTNGVFNERNPVWVKGGNAIVFDSDQSGRRRLYQLSLQSKNTELLFNRDIQAKEASFSTSEKLVYFSGFDPQDRKWEIYSFAFLYKNLNKLTDLNGDCHSAAVSPDEDRVVFTETMRQRPFNQLHLMNWYGNGEQLFTDFNGLDPSWDHRGLKVYFISKKENPKGDIFSMWTDGSHLEQITNSSSIMKNPVKSPDGKYLAVSVLQTGGFDIFLLSAEDY